MKQFDVAALGELLIDFTESGFSAQGNPMLEVNPGGAPCNVLAMLRKLGRKCAFLGKVGNDNFGRLLTDTVRSCGIETRALKFDSEVPTTLAFVHTLAGGEREFSFYRNPGADVCLSAEDLDMEILKDCRIFHFGSLSLTAEPCRTATDLALQTAREAGAWISFDPNLREPLWKDLRDAKKQIAWGLARTDVLKISDNELLFMTGKEDFDEGVRVLRTQYPNLRLIFVTAGEGGSFAYYEGLRVFAPIIVMENTIEKTGAGDTFCGCALNGVLEHGLENWNEAELLKLLQYANAAAAIITTRKGAIRSMPELSEIKALLG